MKIKVQIVGGGSVGSLCNGQRLETFEGKTEEQINQWMQENPLTFVAFSDRMKAGVLEQFMKSPMKIGLSIFDGEAKTGEWHEPLIESAIFNK